MVKINTLSGSLPDDVSRDYTFLGVHRDLFPVSDLIDEAEVLFKPQYQRPKYNSDEYLQEIEILKSTAIKIAKNKVENGKRAYGDGLDNAVLFSNFRVSREELKLDDSRHGGLAGKVEVEAIAYQLKTK
ncbi:MAG TPA: hypothetical protein VKE88_02915 [Candidatus Nanoarchaeia archaeon]|nr:hypothetical protein [Candidatus Nanoarchaeia archaeon]